MMLFLVEVPEGWAFQRLGWGQKGLQLRHQNTVLCSVSDGKQVAQLPSCVQLFATPWILAHQAPLSMGFSRQEYWSGQPVPSPGELPDSGIEPGSAALQADSLPAEAQGKPKNTGVGSLSLLQWIFPTQEMNCVYMHFTHNLTKSCPQTCAISQILQLEYLQNIKVE